MGFVFKDTRSADELQHMFLKVRRKPGHEHDLPIVCEGDIVEDPLNFPLKFLVAPGITVGAFMFYVRKCARIKAHEALFFFFGDKQTIYSPSLSIQEVYDASKDKSGFLFVTVMKESVFGI